MIVPNEMVPAVEMLDKIGQALEDEEEEAESHRDPLTTEINKLVKEKGWSAEERRKYLDELFDGPELPLFAESAEDMDPRVVEALTFLKYDGETPESLAESCKHLGNKSFKTAAARKRAMYYRDALKHYSEGCLHALKAGEREDRTAEEISSMNELFSALLSNRAACQLPLKNYGSAKRDCTDAVRFWPANTKAFFRKAKACLALRQYEEGLTALQEALYLEPENAELETLKVKLSDGLAERQKREAAVAAAEEKEMQASRELFVTCTGRGASLGPSSGAAEGYTMQVSDKLPTLQPDEVSSEGVIAGGLAWPCALLYPQYLQSDFVEAWNESTLVAETLAEIFPEEGAPPPAWDEEREYTCSRLECYLELEATPAFGSAEEWAQWVRLKRAAQGLVASLKSEVASKKLRALETANKIHEDDTKWLRVNPGVTLGDLLRYPGVVVSGGQPMFYVYPTQSAAHKKFLAKHGKRVVSFDPKQLPPPPAPK